MDPNAQRELVDILKRTRPEGDHLIWDGAMGGSKPNPTPQLYHGFRQVSTRLVIWNLLHPDDQAERGFDVTLTCGVRGCVAPGHIVKKGLAPSTAAAAAPTPPTGTLTRTVPTCSECGKRIDGIPSYAAASVTRCKQCSRVSEPNSDEAMKICEDVRNGVAPEARHLPPDEVERLARAAAERKAEQGPAPSISSETQDRQAYAPPISDASPAFSKQLPDPATDPHAIEGLIGESRVAEDAAPSLERARKCLERFTNGVRGTKIDVSLPPITDVSPISAILGELRALRKLLDRPETDIVTAFESAVQTMIAVYGHKRTSQHFTALCALATARKALEEAE